MLCERFGGETPVPKASFVCVQCADTLCTTCEKYHKSIKVSSGHDVKPLGDNFSFSNLAFDTVKIICNDHVGKPLELYCSDHDQACCSICISINHRKCEKVITLEDAAKGISASPRIKNLERDLQSVAIDVETIIKDQKCNLQHFENQFEIENKNIEETFQHLRETLDQQEQVRKTELSKIFNERKGVIEKIITIFEIESKSLENEQRLLDVSVGNASDVQMMIELDKFETRRDKHKNDLIAESRDLQNFNLVLTNTDKSIMEKQIGDFCIIQCDSKPCSITLKNVNDETYEIIRFPNIGTQKNWWVVNSKPDAIAFTVSEVISMVGFISYGVKNSKSMLEVKATVKKGSDTVSEIKKSFIGDEFKDNVTKIYLQNPIDICPGVQYDVVFLMNSKAFCNYGETGKAEMVSEGIVFKFLNSDKSENGTKVNIGQIPGFLFKKKQ